VTAEPLSPPSPASTGSIGVLGGTFDPIHHGHLAVAESVRETLGLERVLFVPAGAPPHKPDRPVSDGEHRAAMVALAIADNPAFELSRVELDRGGPSYTVDTLAILSSTARAAGGRADFTFILSAEAFAEILTWHEPRRLLQLARVAVVPRGEARLPARAWLAEHFPGQEDRVTLLDGPRFRVSGTEIRALAAAGRSVRYLVPASVARYISERRLYPAVERRTS
jgi:nicotinate-nucleotide adenylyltransferase